MTDCDLPKLLEVVSIILSPKSILLLFVSLILIDLVDD